MSSRGLASLLAMPSALRRVLLQATLAAPSPPSALLSPMILSAPSQTQSYSTKRNTPLSKRSTPKRVASSKLATPSKSTTLSKPTTLSSKRGTTSAKRTTPSRRVAPSKLATRAKPTTSQKKATPSKQTLSKQATPSRTPKATPSSSTTSRLPSRDRDPVEGPPRTLSFFPTPPPIIPTRALLSEHPVKLDLTRSTTLFTARPKFLYSAPRFLHLPINTRVPEVCLLGRSNVGKSTLINALAGYGGKKAGNAHGSNVTARKGLAITSAKAGCTKTMNAYGFGPPMSVKPLSRAQQAARKEGGRTRRERRAEPKGREAIKPEKMPQHSMVLMDMPGYGQNSRADWGDEILKYLSRRDILSGAVLLIDAVAGVKAGDKMVLEVLRDAGLKTSVVLTKADKLVTDPDPMVWQNSETLRQACLHVWEELRGVDSGDKGWFEGVGWTPDIFVTGAGDSRMGGMGIDGARLAICRLAGHVAEPVRQAEMPLPEVVPYDQLVFARPSATPWDVDAAEPEEKTKDSVAIGRGRVDPEVKTRESVAVGRGRGRVRPRRVVRNGDDPMEQMKAAIHRPTTGTRITQASF